MGSGLALTHLVKANSESSQLLDYPRASDEEGCDQTGHTPSGYRDSIDTVYRWISL